MSYDIYCYRSELGRPDVDEATDIIEADDDKWAKKEQHPETKLAIVRALVAFNPKLQAFDFDYGEIAKLTAQTIDAARQKFNHIELNPQEGELAVQLIVYDNNVFINVPYWYTGEKAKQVFDQIKAYMLVIYHAAGYFVYDPQAGEAFNPAVHSFEGLEQYLSVSEHLSEIIAPAQPENKKKPWRKLW